MEPEKSEVKEDAAERIKGLEKELAEKTLALHEADVRIAGMETERIRLGEKIAALTGENTAANGDLEIVKDALSDAVKCYREVIVAANPELPVELIGGETVAKLNDSLAKAKGLVGKVKQVIEAGAARVRIPIGAPGRMAGDISMLSAREKIARGMGKE